jgi:hypothetical protein
LIATASTAANVNLSWNPVAGATYEIMRASALSSYATLTTTAATSYPDSSVSAGATYVYKVRAIDSSLRLSPLSAPDAATTKLFQDDPLVVRGTVMKAIHITELRQAVGMMRLAANLGAVSFTDLDPTGLSVKKIHFDQLRTALDQARAALGLPPISYTDPTINVQSTVVQAAHIEELRAGVK